MLAKGQTYFANQMYEQALKGDGAGYVGFTKIADLYSSTACTTADVTWDILFTSLVFKNHLRLIV